ncbi:DNA/RNA-binding protein KIN17-like, partial [Mizuhopecten yessoensis]
KCVVDETEKGWFVAYIDRNPEAIRRQEQVKAKEKMDLTDEERTSKFIQQQIVRAAEKDTTSKAAEFTEFKRENEEEKVTMSLSSLVKKKEEKVKISTDNLFTIPPDSSGSSKGESSTSSQKREATKPGLAGQKRKSALDEIMEFEEKKKEKMNRKDYWLHKGIVVKVVTKKLGEKYYKKKAFVK